MMLLSTITLLTGWLISGGSARKMDFAWINPTSPPTKDVSSTANTYYEGQTMQIVYTLGWGHTVDFYFVSALEETNMYCENQYIGSARPKINQTNVLPWVVDCHELDLTDEHVTNGFHLLANITACEGNGNDRRTTFTYNHASDHFFIKRTPAEERLCYREPTKEEVRRSKLETIWRFIQEEVRKSNLETMWKLIQELGTWFLLLVILLSPVVLTLLSAGERRAKFTSRIRPRKGDVALGKGHVTAGTQSHAKDAPPSPDEDSKPETDSSESWVHCAEIRP